MTDDPAADRTTDPTADPTAGSTDDPAADPAGAAPRWPTPAEWRGAAVLVAATRVAFLLVAWGGAWLLGGGRPVPDTGTLWRRWDADIYAKIAEHGYTSAGSEPWSEAFPPGWPLLVRAGTWLGVSPTVVALVLTTLASLVAVAFLIRLVDEESDEASPDAVAPSPGRRAGLYLLTFPTAVFLVAGYSEALFLAGAIPAFREARRGRWTRVGPFAAVAVASRWAGLFLLLGLAVELVHQQRGRVRRGRAGAPLGLAPPRPAPATWWRGGVALAVGALPAAAYGAWLWVVRGDPLYVLRAQAEGWGREVVGPIDAFRTTWRTWSGDHPTNLLLSWRLEIVAAAIGVALLIVLVRRREWGYATFVGATLAVMLTSTWYYSVPRVLLSLFPLVIVLARWTARVPGRHDVVLAVSAPLAALGVVVFTQGAWFF